MKELQNGRALTERSISNLFLPHNAADCQESAVLGVLQAEFDAVRTPSATGWRHFLRLQGLGSGQDQFDLRRAAEGLATLAWTRNDFLELLDDIRAEVGEDSVVWLPMLRQRLLGHLPQLKQAP